VTPAWPGIEIRIAMAWDDATLWTGADEPATGPSNRDAASATAAAI
jgi:hypothetical protein